MPFRGVASLVLVACVVASSAACSGDDDDDDATPRVSRRGFVDPARMRERQDEFLAFATRELDPGSVTNAIAHAERAARDDAFTFDAEKVTPESLAPVLDDIRGFVDTTDFDVLYLVNLWFGYRDQLPVATREAIEDAFLGFKYWYTEPTPEGVVDNKYYWSENHRLIFHVDEFLAGAAFPDATFRNDGRTGAEHRDGARERILEWMDEKVRFGFSEWHSNVYYQKDLTPLLTLVEFSPDDAVAERAAMLTDLFLLDVALHLQRGTFGATHGRSYMKDKSVATDEDTFALAKLLFDDTSEPYQSAADAGAVLFARAKKYQLPNVVRRIATSDETTVDREHMGVPLDPLAPVTENPEAPFGYDFDDPENVPFWWERGAQTVWQVVPTTIETLDRHDLWDSQFFSPFKPLRDAVGDDPKAAQGFAQQLAPLLGFGLLTEVDTYTYRAPHVMLSTAQDHRPGVFSEQVHSWQATLDEHALVFTTQPKSEPQRGTQWPDSDGYWTGTGSLPRSAQHGTAAIHLYAPQFAPPGPPLDAFTYLDYTHAYFPQEHFDEVVRDGNWTFGRKGDGYVALWSMRPVEWRTYDATDDIFTHGLTEPFDLVARGGPDNAWIVEVGDVKTWKTFDAFREAIGAAAISAQPRPRDGERYGGFDVRYDSPTEGTMTFGWDGPLQVNGATVELHGSQRYDNPWVRAAFESRRYTVEDDAGGLDLDFDALTREVQ